MNDTGASTIHTDLYRSKYSEYDDDDEDCCEIQSGCIKLRKCCYCISLRIGCIVIALLTMSVCISLLALHGCALYWVVTHEKQHLDQSPDPYIGVKVVMALGVVVFSLWIILSALMALAAQRRGMPLLMAWVYYSLAAKIFCFAIAMYCAAIHDTFFDSGYNTASFVLWITLVPFWVYFDFVVYSFKKDIEDEKSNSLTLAAGGTDELQHWDGFHQNIAESKDRLNPPAPLPQTRGSSRAYDPDTPVTSQRRGETNHLYRYDERREPPPRRPRANDVQSERSEQSIGDSLGLANMLVREAEKSRSRWGRNGSRPPDDTPRDDNPRSLRRMSSFHQEEEEAAHDSRPDDRTRHDVEMRSRSSRPVPAKRRSLSRERGKPGSRNHDDSSDHLTRQAEF